MKFLLLIFKNVRRNLLRSILTALGTMVLVLVVTLVWTVLKALDTATTEKSQNFKMICSEQWRFPSMMPISYATLLRDGGARDAGDARPIDFMTWQFYVGTTDPNKHTFESSLFAFAMDPNKLMAMMDDLDSLPANDAARFAQVVAKLKANKRGLIVGKDRLAMIKKQVGDKFKLTGINFKGIDLEFEIVGVFPSGRYNLSAAMNDTYLNDSLDAYKTADGKPHELADKSLALVWLKVPDMETYHKVEQQIAKALGNANPAVKCETASSGIASFLEAYRDLIWGMRWLLSPAIIITLALVIANAISISVRERRTELAVMKVLGFRPVQIMVLVLGEALLLGVGAGVASAGLTYLAVNYIWGGLPFSIAFFPAFLIPINALWWGLAIGAGASLAGSIVPAWNAQSVKVSEVFSKVT
ncbi:MAG: ABC transporter permease [Planctomycetia bacterium]|nr:ABC transporter permease [Planctomycetia bacterium]